MLNVKKIVKRVGFTVGVLIFALGVPATVYVVNNVEDLDDRSRAGSTLICEYKCGDGVCQENPCIGSGCPCVESIDTCPQDCSTSSISCEDKCGDGVCQEVVCSAIGCPCAESSNSCPADCAGPECTCEGKECGYDGCGNFCGQCDDSPPDRCIDHYTLKNYAMIISCENNQCDWEDKFHEISCEYGCRSSDKWSDEAFCVECQIKAGCSEGGPCTAETEGCEDDEVCVDGRCVEDTECTGDNPYLAPTGHCVECLNKDHCESGERCDRGECKKQDNCMVPEDGCGTLPCCDQYEDYPSFTSPPECVEAECGHICLDLDINCGDGLCRGDEDECYCADDCGDGSCKKGDLNCDTEVNMEDYTEFIADYLAYNRRDAYRYRADLKEDGRIRMSDYTEFVEIYLEENT